MIRSRKRKSFGSAINYLRGHALAVGRYLQKFYDIYDWDYVKSFFWDNPIQARVILEDFKKTNEIKISIVMRLFRSGKGKLMYIIGAKGSGKTCTAFFFAEQEHIQNPYRKICYIGKKFNAGVLPDWCDHFSKLSDVPNGYFGIIDEIGIQASARDFNKADNKDLSQILSIARQKDIPLIVLTQDSRLGEVNVWRLRDIVVWKKSNTYELSDRESRSSASYRFWNKVRNVMAPRSKPECLFEYPSERRFIHFKHEVPECWSEELSNIYSGAEFKDSRENLQKKTGKIDRKNSKNKSLKKDKNNFVLELG